MPIVMKHDSLKLLEALGPIQLFIAIGLPIFMCIRMWHVVVTFSGFVLIKLLLNNDAADTLRILLKVRTYVVPHILDCIFHRQTVF